MSEKTMLEEHKEKDLAHNWVSSSRFLWYMSVFLLLAFLGGCFLKAWDYRYKGKPKVEVPTSTQYSPVYK